MRREISVICGQYPWAPRGTGFGRSGLRQLARGSITGVEEAPPLKQLGHLDTDLVHHLQEIGRGRISITFAQRADDAGKSAPLDVDTCRHTLEEVTGHERRDG